MKNKLKEKYYDKTFASYLKLTIYLTKSGEQKKIPKLLEYKNMANSRIIQTIYSQQEEEQEK